MSSMFNRCIQLISKPPEERKGIEIDILLPWLRKRGEILSNVDKDVLRSLLRNCSYEKMKKDEIVLRQGERGDKFYIMLTGKTSVYVDTAMSGEDAPKEISPVEALLQELEKERGRKQGKIRGLDRSQFGKFIIFFDAGKSFGELALINKNALRNATIIVDEDTDLLVIHRNLYNSTLKSKQEAEYQERRAFIKKHHLFRKWTPRFQKLLEMSIIKETLAFDSCIIKQGQPFQGLYFIIKGRARIVVEPDSHKSQYPKMFVGDTVLEKEFGRKAEHKEDRRRDNLLTEHIEVRRRQGYAAAEQRIAHKTVDLCFIDELEIIGDLELVMDFPTYSQSIVCTTGCEVFLIDCKNIERLITKKNQQTIEMLKEIVERKLEMRTYTKAGSEIQLFRKVLNKIEESKPRRILGKHRDKEGRELMMSQLAKLYIEDKTPAMIEPYVQDSVYYVYKSKTRAERKEARMKAQKRSPTKPVEKVSMNVRLQRAKRPPRKAKSRRELEKLASPPENKTIKQTDNGATRYLAQAGIDPSNINVRPHTSIPGAYRSADPDNRSPFRSKSAPPENATYDEFGFQLKEVFDDGDEGLPSKKCDPVNAATVKEIMENMENAQLHKNIDRTRIICSMVDNSVEKGQDINIQKLLKPESAIPVEQPKKTVHSVTKEHEFDFETGNTALADLETRLRHFHGKFTEKKPVVTKMQRYKIKCAEEVPIPGGTVYVKQKTCTSVLGGDGDPGHSHVRRFMIPRHALAVASRAMTRSYKPHTDTYDQDYPSRPPSRTKVRGTWK